MTGFTVLNPHSGGCVERGQEKSQWGGDLDCQSKEMRMRGSGEGAGRAEGWSKGRHFVGIYLFTVISCQIRREMGKRSQGDSKAFGLNNRGLSCARPEVGAPGRGRFGSGWGDTRTQLPLSPSSSSSTWQET